MKFRFFLRLKYTALFSAVGLLFALTGCQSADTTTPYVAVIVKATDSDFWNSVRRGVETAATEYHVRVTFEGPATEEDDAAQNMLIQTALDNHADALLLSAIDQSTCADTVSKAARHNIPIIAIDSNLDHPGVRLFVGTDNTAAGRAAGLAARQSLPADTPLRVGLVTFAADADTGRRREEGLRAVLQKFPEAELTARITVENRVESAETGACTLLQQHPEINVLIGVNEWTTRGIGNAIQKLNVANRVKGIGFDSHIESVDQLETGDMTALIVQNPFAIGYLGVKNAALAITGDKIPDSPIYTSLTTVTRENLFDEDIQKIVFRFDES